MYGASMGKLHCELSLGPAGTVRDGAEYILEERKLGVSIFQLPLLIG